MRMRIGKVQPRRRSKLLHNYVLLHNGGLPTLAAHEFSHLHSVTMQAMMNSSLDGK